MSLVLSRGQFWVAGVRDLLSSKEATVGKMGKRGCGAGASGERVLGCGFQQGHFFKYRAARVKEKEKGLQVCRYLVL